MRGIYFILFRCLKSLYLQWKYWNKLPTQILLMGKWNQNDGVLWGARGMSLLYSSVTGFILFEVDLAGIFWLPFIKWPVGWKLYCTQITGMWRWQWITCPLVIYHVPLTVHVTWLLLFYWLLGWHVLGWGCLIGPLVACFPLFNPSPPSLYVANHIVIILL